MRFPCECYLWIALCAQCVQLACVGEVSAHSPHMGGSEMQSVYVVQGIGVRRLWMVVQDGELITLSGPSLIVQLHLAFFLLLFHSLCPSLPS